MRFGHSLRTRFTVVFIGMLACFALVMLAAVQISAQAQIRKYIYSNIYARQHEMDRGVAMVLDEVNLLYSRMVFDDTLNDLMDPELPPDQKRRLYGEMLSHVGVNPDLFGEVACYLGGELYRSGADNGLDAPSESFLKQVASSSRLLEQGPVAVGRGGEERYLLVGKRMVNYPVADVVGGAFFYVNERAIGERCSSINEELGYSFVVRGGDYVVSHPRPEKIGAAIFDGSVFDFSRTPSYSVKRYGGEKSILILNDFTEVNRLYGLDWNVVSVISYEALYADITRLNYYIVAIGAAALVLGGFVAYRIAGGLTGPVNRLTGRLNAFAETGKKQPASAEAGRGGDEIRQLEKSYDDMVERITNLIETNRQDMENQRKLELDSLQMQINPHFLYNTLDAIAWMAKLKKQPEIEKLVLALARFFRISLHKGDKYITVAEEVELIRNFISIELIRFPDKFTIGYNVAEDVAGEMTLKLILQPIVENAIKHGVSPLDRLGHIQINAYAEGGDIVFEVLDDGQGFLPTEDLFAKSRLLSVPGGYGLKNVDERIKLEYGREYGISVRSRPGSGTKVTLRIAKRGAAPAT